MSAFNETTGNSGHLPWRIGAGRFDIENLTLISAADRILVNPADHLNSQFSFAADPFYVSSETGTFIFAEVWNRSVDRGQIAAFELSSGIVTAAKVVLEEPFHLSYPCVFKWQDNFYMIPEAWEAGKLLLYKASEFPWKWKLESKLFEGDYADPQVFQDGPYFYLFLNSDPLINRSGSLYYSVSPMGPWHTHPANPIVAGDARYARSAGPLLRIGGYIYRFTQDCSKRYGQAVCAAEITNISPEQFSSKILGEVKFERPCWAKHGFHHLHVYNHDGSLQAFFDGYANPNSKS